VKEFTNDVPWEMVLTAGDVADPNRSVTPDMGHIAAETTLALLLPYLADHEAGVAVRDKNGQDVGAVTARDVVKALASGVPEPAQVGA